MKRFNKVVTVAMAVVALASSGMATAQNATPVTRAQLKAELIALEKAGYNPSRSSGADYPLNLQAAERKVAAERSIDSQYGPVTDGTSASGSR
ncbi:membrane protein [Caballeronia temeraria]|uniref:Membrane protein n=1 Tax=Caballeronia temeraria TaxID=1777137 RepID=A0A158DVT7_9BURK|nr:DUF4148 domain-containing protein [Caballeronia temeraria]SAK98732.1 membrane protein [Caballeronia temeraria]